MPAPIAGTSTGMEAMGSLLGGAQPPMSAAGAGADAQQQQLQQTMGRIRDLAEQVKQLGADFPVLADDTQQIQQLLKQMVVKAAQVAPAQTASGLAVPGGGM